MIYFQASPRRVSHGNNKNKKNWLSIFCNKENDYFTLLPRFCFQAIPLCYLSKYLVYNEEIILARQYYHPDSLLMLWDEGQYFASIVIKSKYWDFKIQPIFHQIDPTDGFQKCQLATLSVVWALPSSLW